MKKRNFYPHQVAKRLSGRSLKTLGDGERATLRFFMTKGRKSNLNIQIARTDTADLKNAELEDVAAILSNANPHISIITR